MTTALNLAAIIMAILLIVTIGPLLGIIGAGALFLSGARSNVSMIRGKSSGAKRLSRGF